MIMRSMKNCYKKWKFCKIKLYFIYENNMIKAIASDLGGCLLKENDIEMTSQEEILEREFGNINFDEEYFSWAKQTLSLSEWEIKSILKSLRPKLYSLREERIFEIILEKYPQMIFAIATNHISWIKESLEYLWVLEKCKVVLISWDCGWEKPNEPFYQALIEKLWLSTNEILFVDDGGENIKGAKEVWLKTIYYNRGDILSESILVYLNSIK